MCRSNSRCGISGCKVRHHSLLHSAGSSSNKPDVSQRTGSSPNISNSASAGSRYFAQSARQSQSAENHVHRNSQRSHLFRIVPVTAYGNGKCIETFAFLDEGSNLTLVEEGLIKDLGVVGTPQPLCLGWTGNMSRVEYGSEVGTANRDMQLVFGTRQFTVKLRV